MWEIEYKDEVWHYFFDNDPYAFNLLIRIEELKYTPDAMPLAGCTQIEPDLYCWQVEEHLVYYGVAERKITIVVVKPIE